MFRQSPPNRRRAWRKVAMGTVSSAMVVAAALTAVPQQALAAAATRTLSAQQVASQHGTKVVPIARPADLTQGALAGKLRRATWPGAGKAVVDLAAVAGSRPARAAGLPVLVGPAAGRRGTGKVGVEVVDRAAVPAAWRDGVVLRLDGVAGSAATGQVTVAVDYSGFADAMGADWSRRLRLYALPACALTTPGAAGCGARELPSRNDAAAKTVTADTSLAQPVSQKAVAQAGDLAAAQVGGGVMLALAAGPDGDSGDFKATSLQASSTWAAGNNSGAFTWNYPMRMPPSLNGPGPKIALAYSSSAVDGRSEATNNQPSWIGEGFDWWPGFIERSYKPCADDMGSGANNSTKTGDQCWGTDNAVLSLSGSGGELVKDGTTGQWRISNDDASKIERLTNTVNGDNDNEYWKITGPDGTKYYFGLNRLPGYTGTAPANKTTNSAWTAPVAGNNSGEPCHASGFSSSFCDQAYRWNLDYVVDPHGNTMSYFYGAETNKYAKNLTDSSAVSYVRGGWLDHVDYGTDNRSGTDTENTAAAAPMRVQFGTADRCLSGCTTHDQAHWPDTPWDQECTGSSCAGKYSPTFWTTKRLTSVTTKVWDTAGAAYKNVDQWTLAHTFPDPGDGTRAGLWLESIVHSGVATGPAISGGAVTLPEVNFDWVQLPNRVDTATDGKPAMNWMRIGTIWSESGGKVSVAYSGADCVPGTHMPASPQTNTLRCFPVLEPQPDDTMKTEYFHKYLVTRVTEADLTGGSPDVVTSYEYVGNPAWRHTDDDGLTKDKLRTWSDFRGYASVKTRVGDPGSGIETLSVATYFRGMNGDLDGAGGKRSISLPAIDLNADGDTTDTADAPAVPDDNPYAGMIRQTTDYAGVETAPVGTKVSAPWASDPTATRDMGDTNAYARFSGTATAWTATWLASGGRRVTRADTAYDPTYGQPTQIDDQGDLAVSGDETCTVNTYLRNIGTTLLNLMSEIDVYGRSCGTAPQSDQDVVSMTRTSFDSQAFGQVPTKGDKTRVEVAKAWTTGAGPSWLTQSTSAFDAYGRVTDAADVRSNHTTSVYTPASGAPLTSLAVTNSLGTATKTVEPGWGVPTVSVDVNGRRTEAVFDALGEMTQLWLPNHLRASFPSQPSEMYSYLVRNSGGPNAVTAQKLHAGNAYTVTYQLFDGRLKPRQTQTASLADGHVGTVFTETKYDPAGRKSIESTYFDASVQPSTTLFTILDWQPKQQNVTEYDRAGRPTASVARSSGQELWRTTTTYGGDRVNVTPPTGGTATTTLVDAQQRTTELRRYHDPATVGQDTRALYDRALYHFNRRGQQDVVTDNAGSTWTYQYDLLGRITADHDPDKGDHSASFNDYGDMLTSTDARTQTLAFGYDTLGRKTGEFAGTTSGTKLATWAYDLPGAKGYLASSSRWLNNGTDEYKVKVRGYTPTYLSTGEDYTVPAVTGTTGISGTWTIARTYKVDGQPATLSYPNAGSLGAETLTFTYDPVTGRPEQLQTNAPGLGQYVTDTAYTAYGETSFTQFQLTGGNWLQQSMAYEDTTRRLSQATTIRQTVSQAVADNHYTYDAAGNTTESTQVTSTGVTDRQCLRYDWDKRLSAAWTPSGASCSPNPDASALGGPAPYYLSWTFDTVGNRATQTTHAAAGDTGAVYTYGGANVHGVQAVVTTGPGVSRTDNYEYDAAGNLTKRPGTGLPQVLTWDAEGHLAANSEGGVSSVYTADGTRLIQSDPAYTTLYLPGQEIRVAKSGGAVTAVRYYTYAGRTCAMTATGAGVTWLVTDTQNTQQITVAAGNQAITQRWSGPYGTQRGPAVSWPNARGFVAGDIDTTGLVHIGAREYDPALGRFVSPDPEFDQKDPLSWTNYGYADSTPVTASDPDGRRACLDDCNSKEDREWWAEQRRQEAAKRALIQTYCQLRARAGQPCGPSGPFGTPRPAPGPTPAPGPGGNTQQPLGTPNPTPWGDNRPIPAGCTSNGDGSYHCDGEGEPGLLSDIKMVGYCPISGGLSAYFGVAGSVCIGVDDKGVGFMLTGGTSEGVQAGGWLGMGMVFSNGDLMDQAGGFETTDAGAGWGKIGGDITYATGTSNGRPIWTTAVTGTYGVGSPVTWTHGGSETLVCRFNRDFTFTCGH
ncbi:hypothetical protein Cs7R123_62340 [Catellatospora sp. TT07R-123]|uniref:RHS repeat-associated core domain-containing protein n=1 Tax=Catellatospora sp. TT07R-123 TaxID=2733863 RepID=UPI001B0055CD|nr:RHS repeat-associated core domain-containing protein [Catellatospora sp. TT07R-123]GHJ48892.1 hypothetical protein Cs7R123_62340 [Catellatospora sp. TT07R-123]